MTKSRCHAYAMKSMKALSIWNRQCKFAAKSSIEMWTPNGKQLLPACGHHIRYAERYTVDAYRQQSEKYERPVQELV